METKDKWINVVCKCVFCGEFSLVECVEQDHADWRLGKLAQDAFPYLDATQRETLISGFCPACQVDIF